MTAIEDARAGRVVELMRDAIRGEVDGTTIPVPVEDIRALIAAYERLTAPPTDDERETLAEMVARAIRAGRYSGKMVADPQPPEWHNPVDLRAGRRAADAILASDVWRNRRQGPITDEWEWGAIWTNGVVEGKWFDMGDSFAIREAAERQVDGYVDPQIVLGRRRKAGPWEPVEAARDAS